MQQYAQIECRMVEQRTPYGATYTGVPVRWIGKPQWPVRIDTLELDNKATWNGDRITSFPWPLLIVAEEPWQRTVLCVRLDLCNGLYARLWRLRYRLRYAGSFLKTRILWTLTIWNVANCQHGSFPQWSDIRRPRLPRLPWSK